MYAYITTDADGHVYPGSVCTIDGDTVPVPGRVSIPPLVRDTDDPADRIRAAVDILGWEVVEPLAELLTVHPGHLQVLVDFPGAGA